MLPRTVAALPLTLALAAPVLAAPPTEVVLPGDPPPLALVRKEKVVKVDGETVKLAYPTLAPAHGDDAGRAGHDAVEAALALPNVLKVTLADLERDAKDGSVTGLDYTVDYNAQGILELTYTLETMGAYPSSDVTHVLLDARTGAPITAAKAFDPSKLAELARMADKALRAEIDKALSDPDPDAREIIEGYKDTHFGVGNLDPFEVSADGVTFLYDYDFPHVAQALQPPGRFHFAWLEIQPSLAKGSPLAAIPAAVGGVPDGRDIAP